MIKIIINAISSKKTAGGAFQIATNYILKSMEHTDIDWYYIVSEDIDAVLPHEIKKKNNYFVFPTQPDFKKSYWRVKRELNRLEQNIIADLIYTITSPCYFTFKTKEVMRFTNPHVTQPNRYSMSVFSFKERLFLSIHCWNQKRYLKKCNYFITQTETTKKGILRITGVPKNHVKVVKNVIPAAIEGKNTSHIASEESWIDVACVAAPVAHKNLDIIPDVLYQLKKRGVNIVRIHVTMPEENKIWLGIKSKLRKYHLEDNVVNHGRISQLELVNVYRHCEYCFLPTLLEVFSVSTLEAMYFDLKVVATDFDFNREVLGESCLYYKPKDPKDAAEKLIRIIEDKEMQQTFSKGMKERLLLFGNYDNHFDSIKQFLVDVATHKI